MKNIFDGAPIDHSSEHYNQSQRRSQSNARELQQTIESQARKTVEVRSFRTMIISLGTRDCRSCSINTSLTSGRSVTVPSESQLGGQI